MCRCDKLKAKGFNFIKLELEGDLNRGGDYCDECDEGYVRCSECDGDWEIECETCGGRGTVTTEVEDDEGNTSEEEIECSECEGRGQFYCDYCDEGYNTCDNCGGDYDNCESGDCSIDDFGEKFKELLPKKIRESLTYCESYVDGSVDTEITMTYPVEHIELTPKIIETLNRTADYFGKEIETSNAGLHISICSTPNPDDSKLDDECMKNFNREVKKLMAGMYLIASGGEWTRGFNYRNPQISDTEKYSAIYSHRGKFLEYRIFDTCYEKPKMIMDFIDMIIGTLKYYSKTKNRLDDYLSTGMKVESRLKNAFIDEESKKRALREMSYLLSKGKVDNHIKKLDIKIEE
jgi:hypothetical protein